jgi:hypothetical protein
MEGASITEHLFGIGSILSPVNAADVVAEKLEGID